MVDVKIFPDPGFLAQAALEMFIERAGQSIADHGAFRVVLSGGSTPQALYKLLASEPFSERVDWARVHVFWGDERCVPPDHPDSNYLKASQALLEHVPVRKENIHRIPAENRPEQAAAAYEETLLAYFSSLLDEEQRSAARFDLVLLGMGEDGHTASLFPGTAAVHETVRWVVAHYVDKLAAWRVTLTPAILNRAAAIVFLVAGEGKREALEHVLYGAEQPDRYPAQVIRPISGTLTWMVDEAAASLL
jgi:6-phosphogluconolactonase